LVFIGSLSAGALAGCDVSHRPSASTDNVYTNNYYIPGAGYYHAPFRAWYLWPYNHFDPNTQKYYYGGQWWPAPAQSITNVSSPTADAVQRVAAARTDVRRGGFGSSSRSHSVWS
jgi:hypothetical protein